MHAHCIKPNGVWTGEQEILVIFRTKRKNIHYLQYIYFHEKEDNIYIISICAMHNNRLINNLFLFNTHFNIFIVGLCLPASSIEKDALWPCVCRCLIKSVTSMYSLQHCEIMCLYADKYTLFFFSLYFPCYRINMKIYDHWREYIEKSCMEIDKKKNTPCHSNGSNFLPSSSLFIRIKSNKMPHIWLISRKIGDKTTIFM